MDALRRRQRCDRTAPMTRKLTACRRVRLVPRLLSWGLGLCAIALPAYAAPDAGGNTYTRAVVRSLPSPAEPGRASDRASQAVAARQTAFHDAGFSHWPA